MGVTRAHLINRHSDGAIIQELYAQWYRLHDLAGNTAGTPAKIEDVGGILQLIERWKPKGFWYGVTVNYWK